MSYRGITKNHSFLCLSLFVRLQGTGFLTRYTNKIRTASLIYAPVWCPRTEPPRSSDILDNWQTHLGRPSPALAPRINNAWHLTPILEIVASWFRFWDAGLISQDARLCWQSGGGRICTLVYLQVCAPSFLLIPFQTEKPSSMLPRVRTWRYVGWAG